MLLKLITSCFPSFRYGIFDPASYYVRKMVEFASKTTKKNSLLLDAGAGSCQFKNYFNHLNYESTDFEQIFSKKHKSLHNFICDLRKIPKKDNTYDYILNTEVLEHVEYPQEVLTELCRVLKKDGKLFLSTPQSWEVHGYPYNFFNFTKGGLENLFKKAGFREAIIKPKGGLFVEIAAKIKELPGYLLNQYFLLKKDSKGRIILEKFHPLSILLMPLILILWPITQIIIPGLFFFLDKLDKKKSFTLGYCCIAKK